MFLAKISITNFRSITKTHAIEFSNYSVVVGKNNEGKSNILKAINIAMNVLKGDYRPSSIVIKRRKNDESFYLWERDFPMILQQKPKRSQETKIKLEFHLSSSEINEIAKGLQSVLNGILPIEIIFTKDSRQPTLKIVKKGKGALILDKKKQKIFEYISSQISFTYIPAIRTEEHAMDVINNMISKELSKIESDLEFQEAIRIIKAKQKPVFEKISRTIFNSIVSLLPTIKSVDAFIPDEEIGLSFRTNSELWIDDGTKTRVEAKGDGVKSLVALSLLKDIKKDYNFSFVAIEEPESHLHPGAIRTLYQSIVELSNDSQILVSTHNPLFVNIKNIPSNIIVSDGMATPAEDVKQIRTLLGVKTADNLVSARYILVVEGDDDAISLAAILKSRSSKINEALDNNILAISSIGGSGKLTYKLGLLRNELSIYHVLLDSDQAGVQAFKNAEDEGLIEAKNVTYVKVPGKKESEFEDLIDISIYKDYISRTYSVDIDTSNFRSGKDKWSVRLIQAFDAVGRPHTTKIEDDIKYFIANTISKDPKNVTYNHCDGIIVSLIDSLEQLII